MPSVSYDVTFASSPSTVFDFLADFANDPKWRANVIAMRPLGEPVSPLGGVWSRQMEVRRAPGRVVETEAVITRFERPLRLAVRRANGPVRPEAVYELAPLNEGAQLRFRLEIALRGWTWLLLPLVYAFVALAVRPVLRSDFDRLRACIDGPRNSTT